VPVARRLAAYALSSSIDPASANMVWEPDTVWLLDALGRRDLALGRLEQLQASAWPDLRWAYGEFGRPRLRRQGRGLDLPALRRFVRPPHHGPESVFLRYNPRTFRICG